MGINQFQAPRAPIDGILAGLQAVHNYYGINTERQRQQLQEYQLQQQKAANDPGSPLSQWTRKQTASLYDIGVQKKLITPQQRDSALLQLNGDPNDENSRPLSASEISSSAPQSHLSDLLKAQMSADASVNRLAGLVDVKNKQFEETQNKNASQVGEHFEHDPIIKMSKTNLNSLTKSQSILENPNKPVTSKDLNLAYQDFINAVAAGGAATEGKIHRELPDTWAQTFNELKGKAGEFDDLRQSPTGQQLIGMLKQNIASVRNDMAGAVSDQAYNIYQNYGDNTNAKVQNTAKTKLKAYAPDKYARLFGVDVGQASFSSGLNSPPPGGQQGAGIPSIDDYFKSKKGGK